VYSGWDSAVGLAPGYGMDGPGIESRLGRLSTCPDRPRGPPIVYSWNRLSPRGRGPVRDLNLPSIWYLWVFMASLRVNLPLITCADVCPRVMTLLVVVTKHLFKRLS